LFHLEKNQYYIPSQRDHFLHLPEMIIHYLVLYNIGNLRSVTSKNRRIIT
jgi:hypothetical protein